MRPIRLSIASLFRFLPVFLIALSIACAAQSSSEPGSQRQVYSGRISGPSNLPIAGASIQLEIGNRSLPAVSGPNGHFRISTSYEGPATIRIHARGFAPFQQKILPSTTARLRLSLATDIQRVVVTADRTPLALSQSANPVQVVSGDALHKTADFTLGDQLRQVAGLGFFRRSSTLVSNPTAQGISLRGLGSTAASRTLVLANGIPISDPFGGWIDWNQVPSLAIDQVEVVSGGESNLYGSSAIGGVINIIERQPVATAYAVDLGYGQENTPHASAIGTTVLGPWSGFAAGDFLRTDGYIQVAPDDRGPIDTPANVHYQNGEVFLRRIFGNRATAYLRGNVLNEARGNGTPLQKNSTRLWRYAGGSDWSMKNAGLFSVNLFGSAENYSQTFSSVSDDRASELLVRSQKVPSQRFGASAQWTKLLFPNFTLVAGADVNDIRATDFEIPISHGNANGLSDTSARQRDFGEYVEGLFQYRQWAFTGSLRGDNFLNLDAVQYLQTGNGPITKETIPDRSEAVLSPKLGVVRSLGQHFRLSATAYRAFRSPTLNELYRQFRVGQVVTLANPDLQSERATGWETDAEFTPPWHNSRIRIGYFWTEVNRPVSALTLSVTPALIVKQRRNLGQIRSRGIAIDYATQPRSWLSIDGGYQYVNATVTQFAQNPQLVGNWIPQVAHNAATMQVRASKHGIGMARLLGTLNGRQFDDDQNNFLLHGYFQLDGYVSHEFGSRFELYGAMKNIFDRSIDVGRTPLLTLGTPRMASFGIQIHSPDAAQ